MVRTSLFQGGDTGSTPVGAIVEKGFVARFVASPPVLSYSTSPVK